MLAYGLYRAKLQAHEARKSLYAADTLLSAQALERNDYGLARGLLLRHRPVKDAPDLRGWEWRHLWLATRGMAFAPDDSLFAFSRGDGEVAVVSLPNLETTRVLPSVGSGFGREVTALLFSPDGRQLVVGKGEGSIHVWNAGRWTTERVMTNHTGWVGALAVSPDGSRLVSASADQTLGVWNTTSWQLETQLYGQQGEVWCVQFVPGTPLFVSGGLDFTIRLR